MSLTQQQIEGLNLPPLKEGASLPGLFGGKVPDFLENGGTKRAQDFLKTEEGQKLQAYVEQQLGRKVDTGEMVTILKAEQQRQDGGVMSDLSWKQTMAAAKPDPAPTQTQPSGSMPTVGDALHHGQNRHNVMAAATR